MTPLVHFLTIAAVLVHSTLGCCAHQAHSASGACCEPSDCCDSEPCDSGGCDSGQGGLEHANHSAKSLSQKQLLNGGYQTQPTVPRECDHASCEFSVPEARSCANLRLLAAANSVQWTSRTSLVSVLGNGFDSPILLNDIPLHAMPVRTHLAKSVLLI